MYGGIGEIIAEKSGILNIGMEGIYEAIGAYNMEKRNEIITIVDKGEYQKLMKYINQEDPEAFITVYTVSDMRYLPKK